MSNSTIIRWILTQRCARVVENARRRNCNWLASHIATKNSKNSDPDSTVRHAAFLLRSVISVTGVSDNVTSVLLKYGGEIDARIRIEPVLLGPGHNFNKKYSEHRRSANYASSRSQQGPTTHRLTCPVGTLLGLVMTFAQQGRTPCLCYARFDI